MNTGTSNTKLFGDASGTPNPMNEQNKQWEERFDKEFSALIGWIKLNCKDEIILGKDVNHLDEILKSFISAELLAQKERDTQEQLEELIGEVGETDSEEFPVYNSPTSVRNRERERIRSLLTSRLSNITKK